jgi:hypothetical protein
VIPKIDGQTTLLYYGSALNVQIERGAASRGQSAISRLDFRFLLIFFVDSKGFGGFEIQFSETPADVIGAFDVDLTQSDPTSDVTIEVVEENGESTMLFAHKFILTRRCPAFRTMIDMLPQGSKTC